MNDVAIEIKETLRIADYQATSHIENGQWYWEVSVTIEVEAGSLK